MPPGRLQPALFGGLFIGVLSSLPIVSAGNCCCCLWVLAGGMLAVYLRQQNSPFGVSSSEGAIVGLMAGVIGGVIGVLISIPIEMLMGPYQRQILERIVAARPDIPVDMSMLDRAGTGAAAIVVKFVFGVTSGAIFGMLGGLLGVALFTKNAPRPPQGSVQILPPE